MSKSLKRVRAALEAAGQTPQITETALARTAQDAADALGCTVDQIGKSIVFQGQGSGRAVLFVTAGGNRVNVARATALAGEDLGKADADAIRAQTGFAIGGVSPVGHLSPIQCFFDRRLLDFDVIWAAAGTPHHVFAIDPNELVKICDAQISDFTS